MFVGHYGVALAIRALDRRSRLWEQFLAVQFLDVLWAGFVLLGVERLRIEPNQPWARAMHLEYVEWSHSLGLVLFWSVAASVGYWFWRGSGSIRPAAWLAVAVLSHWMLDLVVHPGDLPLYDDSAKVGFGLWNSPAAFWLEGGLVALGALLYVRSPNCRSPRWAVALLAALLSVNVGFFSFSPPASAIVTALLALLSYLLLPVPVYLVERENT